MLPALRLDYDDVSRRVLLLRDRLDPAVAAEVLFRIDGDEEHRMRFDLRFRKCHVSSGRFPEKGTAGNLPSGETYIVPYEGEAGEPSRTEGALPVQIGDEVVLFTVEQNRVVDVAGDGGAARAERDHVGREPAYGNMAELGFGVLGELGLEPIGEILLDEKLGLHVAFGRSDHFGGAVGPKDFSSPAEVIHLDRIYIPAVQPRIAVASVVLEGEDGGRETILENGSYRVF
jgi:leucyl aminopeptidase (aminopeptidase T)